MIPDVMDEEVRREIHDRAAFLGTEPRKRYYLGPEKKTLMELSLC